MSSKPRFSPQQIEKFNDKILVCLLDLPCRSVLATYLQTKPGFLKAFNMWVAAETCTGFSDDLYEMVEEIETFNDNPLYSLSEPHEKIQYIKQECCRILETIRPVFISYLNEHHKL